MSIQRSSSPVDTPAIGHVVSGQVVCVPLLPEAALHHPPRTRDGGATAFPGDEPTGTVSLQRRGRRETSAGGSADAEPAVPTTEADAFLHLVTVSVRCTVTDGFLLLCPAPNPCIFLCCMLCIRARLAVGSILAAATPFLHSRWASFLRIQSKQTSSGSENLCSAAGIYYRVLTARYSRPFITDAKFNWLEAGCPQVR